MKYEIFNHYVDCIVCIADTLNDARTIAAIVDAQCQESDDEWIPWCEIREIPEQHHSIRCKCISSNQTNRKKENKL